jgi:hypothetical protein
VTTLFITPSTLTPPKARRRCCVKGCGVRGNTNFTIVPPLPKALPANPTSVKQQITYHTKVWTRREYCDRFGIGRNHKSPDLRYCSSHEFESVRFQVTATPPIKKPNGDLESSFAATMEVPKAIGPKSWWSPAIGKSKGTGWDRYNTRVMNSLATETYAKALQQLVEMTELSSGTSRLMITILLHWRQLDCASTWGMKI